MCNKFEIQIYKCISSNIEIFVALFEYTNIIEKNKFYIKYNSIDKITFNSKICHDFITHSIKKYYFTEQQEFIEINNFIKIIKKLYTHPLHYTCLKILKPNDDTIINNFTKKYEILILENLINTFSNKYKFKYQHKVNNYSGDLCINIINDYDDYITGVIIEIDEKDHSNYDSKNEIIREKIIKSNGYNLVRINVKDVSIQNLLNDTFINNFLKDKIEIIDIYLKEQYYIKASQIDPDKLVEEFESKNIAKDFYSIMNKSLGNNLQYNIHIDDVVNYLELYNQESISKILKKEIINKESYIEFNNSEFLDYIRNKDYYLFEKYNNFKYNENKIHILFNKRGFLELIMYINTTKSKKIGCRFIDIYEIATKFIQYMDKCNVEYKNETIKKNIIIKNKNLTIINQQNKIKQLTNFNQFKTKIIMDIIDNQYINKKIKLELMTNYINNISHLK